MQEVINLYSKLPKHICFYKDSIANVLPTLIHISCKNSIKDMQLKPQRDITAHPSELQKFRNLTISSGDKDVEDRYTLLVRA